MPWQSELPNNHPLYVKWLEKTKKLSKSLRSIFPKWQIHLLSEEKNDLTLEQMTLLNVDNPLSWQRNIIHLDDQTPLIIGRALVPEVTFKRYQKELINLKTGSIGEKLLFIDPKIKRSDFLFTVLKKDDLELSQLSKWLLADSFSSIYARSSIFYLEGIYPLMVNEYFLPIFFDKLQVMTKARSDVETD